MTRTVGFRKKAQTASEDTPAFGSMAERVRRGGDASRAVQLCRDGLEKFPNQLSGRVTLGWALLDLGLFDEAREELEYVLKRAPDNLAAIRGMAQLHERSEGAEALSLEEGGEWPVEVNDVEEAVPEAVAASEEEAEYDLETPAEVSAELTIGAEETPDLAAALDGLVEGEDAGHEPARLDEALEMAGLLDAVPAAQPGGQPEVEGEGRAGAAESPIVALERFLDRAKARRDKASESVA